MLTRFEGTLLYNYSPLIRGYQLTNVALTGEAGSLIDGQGQAGFSRWRKQQSKDQDKLRQMGNDTLPHYERVFGAGHGHGADHGHGPSPPPSPPGDGHGGHGDGHDPHGKYGAEKFRIRPAAMTAKLHTNIFDRYKAEMTTLGFLAILVWGCNQAQLYAYVTEQQEALWGTKTGHIFSGSGGSGGSSEYTIGARRRRTRLGGVSALARTQTSSCAAVRRRMASCH